MWLISCTLETFHFEISALNDVAPMKMAPVSVTLEMSQSPMVPYGPSEQSVPRDNFRQVLIALLSSALDCGANTNWLSQKFGEMETRRAKKIT